MSEDKKPNSMKGRTSYDSEIGGLPAIFINRNVTEYPVEVSAPKFDLVPITQQKDIMLNVARLHAQQEYDRIMQLVNVLQDQAAQIKRRLDITDWVHAAEYRFQIAHGQTYWLLFDSQIQKTRLSLLGPKDWSTGVPSHYEYITRVKWLGDYTWIEIEGE
jgi:hypothetical protein